MCQLSIRTEFDLHHQMTSCSGMPLLPSSHSCASVTVDIVVPSAQLNPLVEHVSLISTLQERVRYLLLNFSLNLNFIKCF